MYEEEITTRKLLFSDQQTYNLRLRVRTQKLAKADAERYTKINFEY